VFGRCKRIGATGLAHAMLVAGGYILIALIWFRGHIMAVPTPCPSHHARFRAAAARFAILAANAPATKPASKTSKKEREGRKSTFPTYSD